MNKEDYNKYYIQGSDHYLIPKDEFKELFNEMINWKEESQRQKEVIDKAIEYIEKEYYSKNTVDIESMGITTNKLLQVRNLLNEVSDGGEAILQETGYFERCIYRNNK